MPRFNVLFACSLTQQLSQKHGPALTTSSILCMLSVHSSTGMSVKVWKKQNSQKHVKILPSSKRTTTKSQLNQLTTTTKKKTKMQKTVSKAAKVAGDAMENLSGALKM